MVCEVKRFQERIEQKRGESLRGRAVMKCGRRIREKCLPGMTPHCVLVCLIVNIFLRLFGKNQPPNIDNCTYSYRKLLILTFVRGYCTSLFIGNSPFLNNEERTSLCLLISPFPPFNRRAHVRFIEPLLLFVVKTLSFDRCVTDHPPHL